MNTLFLAYRNPETDVLCTIEYAGLLKGKWSEHQAMGDQYLSRLEPALAHWQGVPLVLFRDINSQRLRMGDFGRKGWSTPGLVMPQQGELLTDVTPAAAELNGMLYVVYRHPGTNDVGIAQYDSIWRRSARLKNISDVEAYLPDGPSAVVFQGSLMFLAKEKNGEREPFCLIKFDGTAWTKEQILVDGKQMLGPSCPGMAVLGNYVYLLYKNYDSDDIRWALYSGSRWYGNEIVEKKVWLKSKYSPRLAAFRDQMHSVYRGWYRERVYHSVAEAGSTWIGNHPIEDKHGDIECTASPALGVHPGKLVEHAYWMTEIDNKKLLSDVNLPGSHDSCAINPWASHDGNFGTLWANQNSSIREQLIAGVRLFDIRLKVLWLRGSYVFITAHGSSPNNEFEPFIDVMNTFEAFLKEQRTEAIVMSVAIDDWNGFGTVKKDDVIAALMGQIKLYSVFISQGVVPVMKDVRGKIYVLNRVDDESHGFAVPVDWSDNTEGDLAASNKNRTFDIWVQDHYCYRASWLILHSAHRDADFSSISGAVWRGQTPSGRAS